MAESVTWQHSCSAGSLGDVAERHHVNPELAAQNDLFQKRCSGLEALKGIKTVPQIAKEFDVHPVQVSDWKKKLSTQAGCVFESSATKEQEDFSIERTELHSKIGELTVMLDFAVKKSKQVGVWSGLPNSSNLNTRS